MQATDKINDLRLKFAEERHLRVASLVSHTGGWIGICRLPGRYGQFENDMDMIKNWAPNAVVTMTTEEELAQANATHLGDKLEALGIRWVHLPVADYGGISGESAQRWPDISKELHKIFDNDGSVLIHCRGGHGRSGMVALRLLVEQGELPADAVFRIRKARPGAIETDEQMSWGKRT